MNRIPTHVLLVEDDPDEARQIQAVLADDKERNFSVDWVRHLGDALARLARGGIDALLVDLMLPDAQGLAVFDQLFAVAPDSVILILSAAADEGMARQAVQGGANDYLVKGHVDAHWLPRALQYLIERKASRDALRVSEARFRAISDASPLGIFVADIHGDCVYTNAAYQDISGLSFDQTLGTDWVTAIHPEDRERVLNDWLEAARGSETFQTEYRFLQEDGSIVWTRVNSAPMFDRSNPQGRVKTVEDISERKAAEFKLRAFEETLFAERERAQVTLDSIGDAVISTDLEGRLTYLNRVAEAMTGWPSAEAIGQLLAEVFNIRDETTRQTAANPAMRAIRKNRAVGLAAHCVLVRRDGFECAIEDSAAPIHDSDGQPAGAVIVFHDASETRTMALKMSHLAQHDFLTGLPNRMLLTERLSRAMGLARRHRKQVGLLFLDLDYFKNVNDSLGHAIGDQLLQSVGERLSANVRTTDTVCRQGGDEFVILLAQIEHPDDATLIAEKLLAAFTPPHRIGEHELHITLSIGITVYPDDGVDLDAILQNADTAMYHAKSNGRNNFQFFKNDMNTRAVRRLQVENSIRRALGHDEFVLHYQPKIDLASGRITGAEALIRWQDPELGLIPPAQFITVAEECGLIVPIGHWALRETCRQVKAWFDAGLAVVPVAVNISAMEFGHRNFLEGVVEVLRETGLPPGLLELELTESVLMQDVEASAAVLTALKAMGLKLAIDDFGTGYSSLSYLKRFPIDTLKIDQSFVRDIVTNADDATIVSAVINMGHSLNLRMIAEGVETADQLDFLLARQCQEAQGYLFSRPLLADAFARLLLTGTIEASVD